MRMISNQRGAPCASSVAKSSETVLTKGQTFYEAPGQLHAVSSNASNTEPAKVLVVVVNEIGKPLTVPEKP